MGQYSAFIEEQLGAGKPDEALAPPQPLQPAPTVEEEPEAAGPYNEFIQREVGHTPNEASGLLQAEERTPDQTAKSNALAKKTNLPPDVVDRNTDLVAQKVRSQAIRNALAESKTMKKFANKDPRNVSLMTEDLAHLTGLDRDWERFSGTAVKMAMELGDVMEAVSKAANTGSDFIADITGINALTDFMFGSEGRKRWEEKNGDKGITSAVLDLVDVLAKQAELRPEDAKPLADYSSKDIVIPAGVTLDQVIDDPLDNYLPFLRDTLVTMIPETAVTLASLPVGVMAIVGRLANERAANNGKEEATLGDMLKVLPSSLAVAFLDRIGGKGFLGLGDDALKSATAKGVTKAVTGATVKESATEFVQEGLESATSTLGTDKGFHAGETLMAAFGGAIAGGPIGGGIRTVTASAEAAVQTKRAKAKTEKLREMNDAGSKMRDIDPEAYAEYQGIAMEEAGIEDVTLTEEGARILNQTYDAQLSEEALAEAAATGGTINMTPEEFWALPQEAINEVAPHVSFNAAELSEAAAREAEEIANAAKVDEKAMQEQGKAVTREATLVRTIQDKLIDTEGAISDPASARAGAEQMAAVITTMAEREGIDPQELAEQWVPELRKEADPEVTEEAAADLKTDDVIRSQTVQLPDADGNLQDVNVGEEFDQIETERDMTEQLLRCVNGG